MALGADWDMQVGHVDDGGTASGTPQIVKVGWSATAAEMKAAVILTGLGTTINTENANSGFCIGATDGTNQFSTCMVAEDGADNPWVRGSNARLVHMLNPVNGAIEYSSTFSQWIDTGIELLTDVNSGADRPIGAFMFAGDLDVDLRKFTFADDPSLGVNIGFTPELVIVFGTIAIAMDDTSTKFNTMSIGAMSRVNGGTEQCCMAFTYQPALPTPTAQNIQSYLDNSKVAAVLNDNAVYSTVTGTIQTDGYKLVDSSGAIECFVLALKGTNRSIDARCRTSDIFVSAADNTIIRGGALNPIARMLGGLFATADNTIQTGRRAGSYGFGFHTATDAFYASQWMYENGLATPTDGVSVSVPLQQRGYNLFGTGTQLVKAAFPTGGAFPKYDRASLDWDNVSTGAKRMMDITIGKGPATIIHGGNLLGGTIY